jgi:ABC-2 type transport system permease protein
MSVAGSGTIYDLGYRRYDGPRLGRRAAVRALFEHSVRVVWGIGRGTRAKVVPMGLAAMAALPAVVALGIAAIAGQFGGTADDLSPIRYETYVPYVSGIVFLFVAAQAPELLGRDQRYGVLGLYFARALRREDYVAARLAAFMLAILGLILVPQGLLFVGRALAAQDIVAAASRDLPSLPPVLAQALATAGVLGGLALAIAAFTPRRAYATAAIIAIVTAMPVVAEIGGRAARGLGGEVLTLLSPPHVLEATNAVFFGGWIVGVGSGLAGEWYVAAAIAISLGSLAVLLRRYRSLVP